MLKFVSKVHIQFNAMRPHQPSCMEFIALCKGHNAKESNPDCDILVKRCTDDCLPTINVTFVNGVKETFDARTISAQAIRSRILQKGELLQTEQMFREAGLSWPIIIPAEELHQMVLGTKPRKAEEQ